MKPLKEAISDAQSRARVILKHYKESGPAGAAQAAKIEQILQEANRALISEDVTRMSYVYRKLKKINGG